MSSRVQWLLREEKTSEIAVHFTGFCQGEIERRKFQNLSFKTDKILQWVVGKIVSGNPSDGHDGTGTFGKG
jgi:hypothetical protein